MAHAISIGHTTMNQSIDESSGREMFIKPSLTSLIVITAPNTITAPLSFVANIVIMTIIIRQPKFHIPPYVLLCSLAVSDMLHISTHFLQCIVNMFHTFLTGHPAQLLSGDCSIIGTLSVIAIGCQAVNLVAIAVNRYIMVLHATSYKRLYTTRRTVTCVVVTNVIGVLSVAPLINGLYYDGTFFVCRPLKTVSNEIIINLRNVLTILALLYCYSRTLWKVYTTKRAAARRGANRDHLDQVPVICKKEISLMVQFVIICSVYVLSWGFYVMFVVLDRHTAAHMEGPRYNLLFWVSINTTINPAVYFTFNRDLRHHMLTCCHSKNTREYS